MICHHLGMVHLSDFMDFGEQIQDLIIERDPSI